MKNRRKLIGLAICIALVCVILNCKSNSKPPSSPPKHKQLPKVFVNKTNITWHFHKIGIFTTMSCQKKPHEIRAVQSWHKLTPQPRIFVFGECLDTELKPFAKLITKYDKTHDGMPLFSSMLHNTIRLGTLYAVDAIVWVNADIVLHRDFTHGLNVLFQLFANEIAWMGVVGRFDTETLVSDTAARQKQNQHTLGGYDVFIWNLPKLTPVRYPFPPFTRTANRWDNWLVSEASAQRLVCDVTDIITAQHVAHEYRLSERVPRDKLAKTWGNLHYGGWHNLHNRVVEHVHRRGHSDKLGTPKSVQLKVTPQNNVEISKHSVVVKEYLPKYQPYYLFLKSSYDHKKTLFMSFESAVVFTGGTGKFSNIIFNFGCNFKQIHPNARIIIVAFDQEMYVKAYMQGYETFLVDNPLQDSLHAESYGSSLYKTTTKIKTLVALDVLKNSNLATYIWIDPDVIIFKEILNHLLDNPNDFVVQENTPSNKPRKNMKVNSGMYKINNLEWIKTALQGIVDDGSRHNESEQMSWDRVLCDKYNLQKVVCYWQQYTIHFLQRHEYATGSDKDISTIQLKQKKVPRKLRAWHNNWIKPVEQKTKRSAEFGFVFFNSLVGVCNYELARRSGA